METKARKSKLQSNGKIYSPNFVPMVKNIQFYVSIRDTLDIHKTVYLYYE